MNAIIMFNGACPVDWVWVLTGIERLFVAALLGALIGIEREHRGRSAGLRTQLLVALGAALAMFVSLTFGKVYGAAGGAFRIDPARVAYGVMGGIGFLGAGAIVRYGIGIRGLTTAASLWCNAAVGLACGFGMYAVATAATLIVMFALTVLSLLDRWLPSRIYKSLTVVLPASTKDNLTRLQEALKDRGIRIVNTEIHRDITTDTEQIITHISMSSRTNMDVLMSLSEDLTNIRKIKLS